MLLTLPLSGAKEGATLDCGITKDGTVDDAVPSPPMNVGGRVDGPGPSNETGPLLIVDGVAPN